MSRKNKSLPRIIYVIELDVAVADVPRFAFENPDYVAGLPCYYVGSSTMSAAERFWLHKKGHRTASAIAHQFGKTLRLDLSPQQIPIRRQEALEMEVLVAHKLRARGCGAWQK